MSEHEWARRGHAPAAWIFCRCGWSHASLFDFVNERALARHIAMHQTSGPS